MTARTKKLRGIQSVKAGRVGNFASKSFGRTEIIYEQKITKICPLRQNKPGSALPGIVYGVKSALATVLQGLEDKFCTEVADWACQEFGDWLDENESCTSVAFSIGIDASEDEEVDILTFYFINHDASKVVELEIESKQYELDRD